MEDPNPVENIDSLGDFMFQTSDKYHLLRKVHTVNQCTTDYCLKFEASKHPTYLYFQLGKGPYLDRLT